ncbi:hypothetical protein GOV10_03660 [Candidatus Woesearchaeota archaeon]|nr:hypothetical protein [Candidatus Woesearchaeota archaeon]
MKSYFWGRVKDSSVVRWFAARKLRTLIVFAYLCVFSFLGGSVWLFLLFFPVYWQLWFKVDVAPDWW